jgi:hypothetical protein
MRDSGFVYIPHCRAHAAFHGCLQNFEAVRDTFVRHAGYNKWAESKRLIVLNP